MGEAAFFLLGPPTLVSGLFTGGPAGVPGVTSKGARLRRAPPWGDTSPDTYPDEPVVPPAANPGATTEGTDATTHNYVSMFKVVPDKVYASIGAVGGTIPVPITAASLVPGFFVADSSFIFSMPCCL